MVSNNVVYISSISGGKCIENTHADKGECRLRKWNKSTAQQWLVESSQENPHEVAFKSVADDKYLAALQPDKRNGGKIGIQEEKQWWTLEAGRGPGWWHVKSNSSFGGGKAGYLNDEWGRMQDDNKIQTYQFEEGNPGFNTFYFSSVEAADAGTLFQSTPAENGDSGRKEEVSREQEFVQRDKELGERDQKLAEREQKLAKREQSLEEQEAATAQSHDKLAEREQELGKHEQSLKEQDAATAQNHEKLAEREQKLAEREQSLKEQEAATAQKHEKPSPKIDKEEATPSTAAKPGNNDAERTRTLDERAGLLAKNEAALEHKAKRSGGTTSKNMPRTDDHEACRLQRENDNLRLEIKIKDLERQLRQRVCTHNVKRPPRKIDRKVVGYVYT